VLDRPCRPWLTSRSPARADRQVIAVDGKTARGSRRGDGRAVHLFAALDQNAGIVLGQSGSVDAKTNEINAFGPLLDRLDITGAITTADALHTHLAHVTYLSGRAGMHFHRQGQPAQPGPSAASVLWE